MENLAGRSIKDYAILERVEAGVHSDLYRGYRSVLGREVAIRIIAAEIAGMPWFIRRFESEARRLARLEHMHIVPLYDFWRDPDGAYLVRRWMRGGNLCEVLSSLDSRGFLNRTDVAEIAEQTGLAPSIVQCVVLTLAPWVDRFRMAQRLR